MVVKSTPEQLSYAKLHYRITKQRGKAAGLVCVDCSGPAVEWSHIHDTDPEDTDNYEPRCKKCHEIYDVVSQETRQKISTAMKARRLNPEHKKRIGDAQRGVSVPSRGRRGRKLMDLTPTEVSRVLGAYCKDYAAGAFAYPTRKELEAAPESIYQWADHPGFVAIVKEYSSPSRRNDFTGRPYTISGRVATHVARLDGATVPDLSTFDYVFAYLDDLPLHDALRKQSFGLWGARVSSSSELIGCFTQVDTGYAGHYAGHDLATVTSVPALLDDHARLVIEDEVLAINGYADHWPLYSDGSWGALCLKGFYPEDPTKDMKPAEMPKTWQSENPDDLLRTCEWTELSADLPFLTSWVQGIEWWDRVERVRLLQMAGRGGKGGKLQRHTDIGDKAMGTGDGQIMRFHVPIVTDPRIVLRTWDLTGVETQTHLQKWHCYYLDARKPHAVTNPTGVDRVHLVVDVVANQEVRELVRSWYHYDLL